MTHIYETRPRRSGKTASLHAWQERHLAALADHVAVTSGQHPDHVAQVLRRLLETPPTPRDLGLRPLAPKPTLRQLNAPEHHNRYGPPLHPTPDCARRRHRAWYG